MFSDMDHYGTLAFTLGFSISCCSKFPLKTYHLVSLEQTMYAAQRYCQTHYTELATINSMDDINKLPPRPSKDAWIGLIDHVSSWKTLGNDSNSWRWSETSGHSTTPYSNWFKTEPNSGKWDRLCVELYATGTWADESCSKANSFICSNVSGQKQKSFVFYPEKKTWTSAQEYCREHHTDLVRIENSDDNSKASADVPSDSQAWIGLYRVRWRWVDGSQNSFTNWRSGSPDTSTENCVVVDMQQQWNDVKCAQPFIFICQQVWKLNASVKIRILTDADLTNAAAEGQLLQQLGVHLEILGWTKFTLKWKIKPTK